MLINYIDNIDYHIALDTIITGKGQLKILGVLLDMVDVDNKLIITNQTTLAKKLGVSRKVLSGLLTRLDKSNLATKIDTGEYQINPYIFIGKRVRSNATREALQNQWTDNNTQSPLR